MYTLRTRSGQSGLSVCLPSAEGRAESEMTCALSGKHLGHIASPEPYDDFTVIGPNSRQEASSERACRSPTCLTNARARRSVVFSERGRRSDIMISSNGVPQSALRTKGRCKEGTVLGRGRFSLLRNLTTRLCFPTDWLAIGAWYVMIAAVYSLSVDGVHLPSNSSCRNERIEAISQDRGSTFPAEHQPEKNRPFRGVKAAGKRCPSLRDCVHSSPPETARFGTEFLLPWSPAHVLLLLSKICRAG